ncbi:hypothetical protein HY419_01430, partial [candidate division WWE3 bacterium]|nr:hypothetical protein [candidate division WWE3 bacterium]
MNQRYKKTKYVHPNVLAFFPSKHQVKVNLWESLRSYALDYPPIVQKRLEWIIFYETIAKQDATYTAKYFSISRKTFHKWYKLFKSSHHNLDSLVDRSKAPKKKRSWMVTALEEDRVYNLR